MRSNKGRKTNGAAPPRRCSRLIPLDSVEPRQTEWLWQHRIPLGELTIMDGDPSVNKSTVLLDLASRVSTGREMPDGSPGMEGGVILMLAEDSLEKTIVQRLRVAGANHRRLAAIKGNVLLPNGLPAVEEAICEYRAKLVLIDPLMAFLGSDANGDQKVRRALTPLKEVAERTDAAVVMVRHLTKRGSKHWLYRGSGSIGIIAATRSGLLIGRSPDDQNLRVLCHVKSNLGPLAKSLLFEPVDHNGIVHVVWRGECDYGPERLLAPPSPENGRLTETMAFLMDILQSGPIAQREVKAKAVTAGFAWRTVERAKEILGIVSQRRGFGPGSICYWHLPEDESVGIS